MRKSVKSLQKQAVGVNFNSHNSLSGNLWTIPNELSFMHLNDLRYIWLVHACHVRMKYIVHRWRVKSYVACLAQIVACVFEKKKFYSCYKRSIPCDTTIWTKTWKGVFQAGIQKWNKINFKNKICQLQFSTEK